MIANRILRSGMGKLSAVWKLCRSRKLNLNFNVIFPADQKARSRRIVDYFYALPWFLLRFSLLVSTVACGASMYFRTTNQWALKNLGDNFLYKQIGLRPIVLSSFHRPNHENAQNFLVILFLGDTLKTHKLYCFSESKIGRRLKTRALIQRIHQGKRAANDVCSWSGFLAECEVIERNAHSVSISTISDVKSTIEIRPESAYEPEKRHDLVVCMAPMYIYTDWYVMLLGIETWLSTGATKIIVPVQSCTTTAYRILKQYETSGQLILRHWPKWPLLSDVNPNGLILSRGIEESHVACLHFVKPWADLVVFTDFDDMLLPNQLTNLHSTSNLQLLQQFSRDYPRAGSFLFEHRDVQLVLPSKEQTATSLKHFNFDFLEKTNWKTLCRLVRMKTRVVANASRVDSVNMHETGIHRFGYNQVRIPCRMAHFHHLRHSYSTMGVNEKPIHLHPLATLINRNFQERLENSQLREIADLQLNTSSAESFLDFDTCMGSINSEHWHLAVSRCLTPHVCHPRLKKNVSCVASRGSYEFTRSADDFLIVLRNASIVESQPNCEAPLPDLNGDHFYLP